MANDVNIPPPVKSTKMFFASQLMVNCFVLSAEPLLY